MNRIHAHAHTLTQSHTDLRAYMQIPAHTLAKKRELRERETEKLSRHFFAQYQSSS